MLNWIAIFGGRYLFELGGPLQGTVASLPRSDVVFDSARLWAIWGNVALQALHAGIFVAFLGLLVYYVILNRTTLGFEVRAVGFNPEAARYSGIPVRRSYFLALAISGAFAGTAGAVDVLGVKFAVDVSNLPASTVGFTGIAVALLGRNKPIGILLAALLFAALQVGTSSRQLDPDVFDPERAKNLATMIQALVIFFVGAELLILTIWGARGKLIRFRPQRAGGARLSSYAASIRDAARGLDAGQGAGVAGVGLGLLAFLVTIPPITSRSIGVPLALGFIGLALAIAALARGERKLGLWAATASVLGAGAGIWIQGVERETLEAVFTTGLVAATLRFATPLAFAAMGGIFSERSGVVNIGLEGMMLVGAFFAVWGSIWSGTWAVGVVMAMIFGGLLALIHAYFCIHLRADQIVSGFAVNLLALGVTGFLFITIYPSGIPTGISRIPNVELGFLSEIPLVGRLPRRRLRKPEPARLAHAAHGRPHVRRALQDADRPADPRGRRASPRGGHGRDLGLRRALRGGRHVRRPRRPRRRVPVARLRRELRREHDERAGLHRPRRRHLRQVAAGLGVRSPRSSSGSDSRSRSPSSARRTSRRTSSRPCRTCSR